MEKKSLLTNISYSDERGFVAINMGSGGTMPTISINSETIPGAWELAVLNCWDFGAEVPTHYDNPGDPPSKEATIMVKVDNPFNEPRIHKNFPGGPVELEAYRLEVVEGIHDDWIDPKAGKWTYTYHDRITNYNPAKNKEALLNNQKGLLSKGVDQLELVLNMLKEDITSKASQAITWYPSADPELKGDRPCLQRMWFRVLKDDKEDLYLNLNTHWRSRDLYKAWPMNVLAITDWQRQISKRLSGRIKKRVKVGSYVDISDSLHIYGSYWKDDKFQNEIKKMKTRPIKERVWTSDHPAFKMMTDEARENLLKDPNFYAKGDMK